MNLPHQFLNDVLYLYQDHPVPKKQLQLVGVTAMFLASKYEEMYPPEISDFAYVTDKAYTTAQIRDMEMTILRVLKFQLGRPLPLQFLRRASKIYEVCKVLIQPKPDFWDILSATRVHSWLVSPLRWLLINTPWQNTSWSWPWSTTRWFTSHLPWWQVLLWLLHWRS